MSAVAKPFQEATVRAAEAALRREDGTRRFLVADEVGLEKTVVARDVIGKLIVRQRKPLIVFYVTSGKVGDQKKRDLLECLPEGERSKALSGADRLGLMPFTDPPEGRVHLYALTPGTSFPAAGSRSSPGRAMERAFTCFWRDLMNPLRLSILAGAVALVPAAQPAIARGAAAFADFAVGPQYDTTHVYVPAADFNAFVQSFVATFGGKPNPGGVFQVTPTASRTHSQVIITPSGSVSVFGFVTPIPYPFGDERVGYLVKDMDGAVTAARAAGAIRVVDTFPDPIGKDTLIQWPGGSVMQLYWHTKTPNYPVPASVPESRIYLTADSADAYVASWKRFAHATVVSDDRTAPGEEIGQPGKPCRRIRLTSGFGKTTLIVTNGVLAWPYGRELTGYEVPDLDAALARASAAGVTTLVSPYNAGDRRAAMVRFPGGYIAEIHAAS